MENSNQDELMFDPLTGEPIKHEDNTVNNADPMADQPTQNQPTGYDPMTGQPTQNQPTGYDPMTGQPIYNQPTGYDPMTGQPIQNQPTGYDPMTGQPIYDQPQNQKKSKPGLGGAAKLPVIIGAAVAAVIVVVLLGVVIVKAATPTYLKVLSATVKTFDDKPYIVEDIEPILKIANSNKYTLGISGEIEDNKFTFDTIVSSDRYQINVTADGDDIDNLSATLDLDSSAISLYVPQLSKKVLRYEYTGKAKGYLTDELIDEDDLEEINDVLKGLVDYDGASDIKNDIYKALKKACKELEFEKLDSDSFEVDGKDVNCKGYRVKIGKSFYKTFLKELESSISDKDYADSFAMAIGYDDFGDYIDYLEDELSDIDTAKVSFYVYKNMLAAVIIDVDTKIEIDFKGGDYRIQNIEVKEKSTRTTLLEMEGSTKSNVETLEFSVYGYDLGSIEYNKKTGKFDIDFGSDLSIEGTLNSSSSKVSVDVETFKVDGTRLDCDDLNVTLSNSAKFTKLDSSKTFDIGNADEDDWEDLIDEMEDGLEDLGLDNLIWYLMFMF